MVEQTDTEQVEHWTGGAAFNFVDASVQQKPAISKTWFHTGAFLDKEKILSLFEHEYWYNEMVRRNLFPYFEKNTNVLTDYQKNIKALENKDKDKRVSSGSS